MGIAGGLTLFWGLKLYGGLLGPFLLALALAYLLSPLVARLEQRRVPRGLAILLVALPPVIALIGLAVLAGPQLWSQAVSVVNAMPRFVTTVLGFLDGIRLRLEGLSFLTPEQRSWLHDLNAEQVAALFQAERRRRCCRDWQLGDWPSSASLGPSLASLAIWW